MRHRHDTAKADGSKTARFLWLLPPWLLAAGPLFALAALVWPLAGEAQLPKSALPKNPKLCPKNQNPAPERSTRACQKPEPARPKGQPRACQNQNPAPEQSTCACQKPEPARPKNQNRFPSPPNWGVSIQSRDTECSIAHPAALEQGNFCRKSGRFFGAFRA